MERRDGRRGFLQLSSSELFVESRRRGGAGVRAGAFYFCFRQFTMRRARSTNSPLSQACRDQAAEVQALRADLVGSVGHSPLGSEPADPAVPADAADSGSAGSANGDGTGRRARKGRGGRGRGGQVGRGGEEARLLAATSRGGGADEGRRRRSVTLVLGLGATTIGGGAAALACLSQVPLPGPSPRSPRGIDDAETRLNVTIRALVSR